MSGFLRNTRLAFNSVIETTGFQLVRPDESIYKMSYQPFPKTLKAAEKARLSVGDYIDAKFHVPGATQEAIDQMALLGIFRNGIEKVCEIGPGSGRYLAKVLEQCKPGVYEIYETDPPWAAWLEKTYHVIACHADGISLKQTNDESVDLVHAHKVFVYLPCVVVSQYLDEMSRVVRKDGWIVFDVVSENCMTEELLRKWVAMHVFYPCMMSRDYVVDFLKRRGCALQGSFFATMRPGYSEYLVFRKAASG